AANLAFDGPLTVFAQQVDLSGTTGFSGPLQINGGTLNVKTNCAVPSIQLLRGKLTRTGNIVLTSVSPNMDLGAATLDCALGGVTTITMAAVDAATINFAGSFNGVVNVAQGDIFFGVNNPLGGATLNIASKRDAAVTINENILIGSDIYLNNASG